MNGTITTTVLNRNAGEDLIYAAAITANKSIEDFRLPLSTEDWIRWIKSEHSPIRSVLIRVTVEGVSPRTISHITRHKIGVEFYVSTRRPDRTKDPEAPYTLCFVANPQAIVNMARKRLCTNAHEEIRMLFSNIQTAWGFYSDSPLLKALSECMMPDCEYRGGCNEMKSCGRYPSTGIGE